MNLMKEDRPLWERLTFGFAIGFGAMVLFGSVGPMIDAVAHALRTEYAPTVQPVVEHEIALVFIGSPECAYSTSADVEAAVRRLKREIQEIAQEQGIPFRMVGISVNGDPLEGLRFLRAFGQFDEVAAGGFTGTRRLSGSFLGIPRAWRPHRNSS